MIVAMIVLGNQTRLLGVVGLAFAITASAQWDPYPWKRLPRTADGKVDLNAPAQRTPYGKIDLSGFWMPENPTKYLLNLAADMKGRTFR